MYIDVMYVERMIDRWQKEIEKRGGSDVEI